MIQDSQFSSDRYSLFNQNVFIKNKGEGKMFNLIPRCHLFTVATVLNSNCLSRGKTFRAFTQIVAISLIAA